MEVAGIVLGALPLLISAVENYEVTFQPFVIFFQHIKEMKRFGTKLGTQRAVFRNNCQILLSIIGEDLDSILENANRKDQAVIQRLDELLGESCGQCFSITKLISDSLHKIMQETAGFREIVEKEVSLK